MQDTDKCHSGTARNIIVDQIRLNYVKICKMNYEKYSVHYFKPQVRVCNVSQIKPINVQVEDNLADFF